MQVPEFPQPRDSLVSLPMVDVEKQERVYDLLVGAGLHPVPRQAEKKIPVLRFWSNAHAPVDKSDAMLDAGYGWCIVPAFEQMNLIILDLDVAGVANAREVYTRIQMMSQTNFTVYTASGGIHLYYQVPEGTPLVPKKLMGWIDIRQKGVLSQVVSLGSHYQYNDGWEHKGLTEGYIGEYTKGSHFVPEIPVMSERLLVWLMQYGDENRLPNGVKRLEGEEFAEQRSGGKLLKQHQALDVSDRVATTLEVLSFVLPALPGDYETWVQMWMSAHHASGGAEDVLEFIIAHPDVTWSDGARGQQKFRRDWLGHTPKAGGYTAASLYYLGVKYGWTTTSEGDAHGFNLEINTHYIADWVATLPELPKRVLLRSQTGSGKTYAIRDIWSRLGEPKSVIFVPSIKLALDLATGLQKLGLPAQPYCDPVGHVLERKVLASAKVLVSTLQSFGKYIGTTEGYGLVYIEECDQLFRQFAGAGGRQATHVTQMQSVTGFKLLQTAFDTTNVWGVDATMTQVSFAAFEMLSKGDYISVDNTYITPKPMVQFLEGKQEVLTLIAEKLLAGKTVVVPCDTREAAEVVVATMVEAGVVLKADALAVTAHTAEIDERVTRFAANASEQAHNYRLVAYNSAMASGVSVVGFTPDVVVQYSTGYLTPRTQLQLLNRYRQQREVFCFYQLRTIAMVNAPASVLMENAERLADTEAAYLGLIPVEITDLAQLRDYLRALTRVDDAQQQRNPVAFYMGLLATDGREIVDAQVGRVSEMIEGERKKVVAMRREMRQQVAISWRGVEPIRDKAPAGYSELQVQCGKAHYAIFEALSGNIPVDVDDELIYTTVMSMYKTRRALITFMFQSEAARSTELALSDRERAYMARIPDISRAMLLSSVRMLLPNVGVTVDQSTLIARTEAFITEIEEQAWLFDAVVNSPNRRFADIKAKYEVDQDRFAVELARAILAKIGVKINYRKGFIKFTNIREVTDFLNWRYGQPMEIKLSAVEIKTIAHERIRYVAQLAKMSPEMLAVVYAELQDVQLVTAMHRAASGVF